MARGGREQDADDFVLHETQPFRAATAVPIFQQHGLGDLARGDQFGFQKLCRGGAKSIFRPGMFLGQRLNGGGYPRAVETFVAFRPALGQ